MATLTPIDAEGDRREGGYLVSGSSTQSSRGYRGRSGHTLTALLSEASGRLNDDPDTRSIAH